MISVDFLVIQSLRAFRRAALAGLLVGLVSCWVVSLLRLSVCVCVFVCVCVCVCVCVRSFVSTSFE